MLQCQVAIRNCCDGAICPEMTLEILRFMIVMPPKTLGYIVLFGSCFYLRLGFVDRYVEVGLVKIYC